MMLLILDQNPMKSVDYLIKTGNKKLLHSQLLEVMQIISSAYSFKIFPELKQAKEIQGWVGKNPVWVFQYATTLYNEVSKYINLSESTKEKYQKILLSLYLYLSKEWNCTKNIEDGILRFNSRYKNDLNNNQLYPIELVVRQYRKYLNWKLEGEDEI